MAWENLPADADLRHTRRNVLDVTIDPGAQRPARAGGAVCGARR
ncbi:hypothetical protein ACH49O_25225 [Streptomyces coeruleorubidus]